MLAMSRKKRDLNILNGPHPEQVKWLIAARAYPRVFIAVGRQAGKSSSRRFFFIDKQTHVPGFFSMAYMSHGHMPAESAFDKDLSDFEKAGMVANSKNKDQLRYIDLVPIQCGDPACAHPAHHGAPGPLGNKGCRIFYWSGDPDAHQRCQGETLHFALLDEASHLPEAAMRETIIPMFNTTKGNLVVMGSPIPEGIGFEWFGREWSKGDPDSISRDADYISFNAPSESNPYGDPKSIAIGRRSCRSRAEELCLYDGKFVTDLGQVFENLDSVFVLQGRTVYDGPRHKHVVYRDPKPGEPTVVSIDWARDEDYTWVDCFSRDTMEQLGFLWFRDTNYEDQFPTVTKFVDWAGKPQIWADARDGGSAISEALRKRYGANAYPVKWTNGGKFDKQASVLRGVDLCQRAAWKMIADPVQREQFRLYTKTKMPSGGFKYEAPRGVADDAVTAALYAAYALPEKPNIETPKVEAEAVSDSAWYHFLFRHTTFAKVNPFRIRRRA